MLDEQLDFDKDAVGACEGRQAAKHAVSRPRHSCHCASVEQVTATHPLHSSILENFNFADSQQNASTSLEKTLQFFDLPRSTTFKSASKILSKFTIIVYSSSRLIMIDD